MKTFEELLAEGSKPKYASNVHAQTGLVSFKYPNQFAWIGSWRGHTGNTAEDTALLKADTYDKTLYKVKSGEMLARIANTRTTADGKQNASIVKINFVKGTITFLKDYENDGTEFESRGLKLSFISSSPAIFTDYINKEIR